ncbi:MAG: tRNA lysidine(34) synthetase TilS [Deltaproteobacteria bacterium]|nr:tRNA lysidine(34) synthetase TilS [Deltaproteobacteria bacterium]
MRDTRKDYILTEGIITDGTTVCVGVSGGVDSMVLLHALSSVREELRLTLIVCHLNHNLRAQESERDFKFVKAAAKSLGLKFESKKLTKKSLDAKRGESLQAWARGERKDFFESIARKYNSKAIALAHNADDQAETIIMRMMKGASLTGLRGIEAKSGIYLRPMLNTSRAEIKAFAKKNKVAFVEDSSNKSLKYLRNKVRLRFIPLIEKEYNPNIRATLVRMARGLKRDDDYIDKAATKNFKRLAKKGKKKVTFERKKLLRVDAALLPRLLLKSVASMGEDASGIRTPQIESFLSTIKSRRSNLTIELTKGLYLQRAYDTISISTIKPKPREETFGEVRLKIPGVTLIEELGCKLTTAVITPSKRATNDKNTASFDLDEIEGAITVRTFQAGDRLKPLGMEGTKKVKDIFIDAKVPLLDRQSIPILISKSNNEILWVAGLRQARTFKVEKKTRRVVKITLS